jgi:hypothetical protein
MKSLIHWWKWNIHTPIRHFFGLKAKTDWISAYSFMAKKMLPYVYDFRDNKKHGTPCFDKEDCNFIDEEAIDKDREEKWNYIINEIIFALEYCADENYDDCLVPNPLYNPKQKKFFKETEPNEQGFVSMDINEDYGKFKIDRDLLNKKLDRVQNGLKLMGEYFMNLWD